MTSWQAVSLQISQHCSTAVGLDRVVALNGLFGVSSAASFVVISLPRAITIMRKVHTLDVDQEGKVYAILKGCRWGRGNVFFLCRFPCWSAYISKSMHFGLIRVDLYGTGIGKAKRGCKF